MKILIVKLGALGDVLRTTPLLTELRRRYPDSEITWLVDTQCREVLEHNPLIDHLVSYSEDSVLDLKRHAFDLAVNLDKEAEAVEQAIVKTLEQGYRTKDIQSPGAKLVGTREMGDRIVAARG